MEQSIRDDRTPAPDALALSAGRSNSICEYYKKQGHPEDRCWKKYPTLRPALLNPTPAPASASALSARIPEGPVRHVTMENPDPGDGSCGGLVDGVMHSWY
jgi:hypothetical protein